MDQLGDPVAIAPIPLEYGGHKFRSSLEADWAATFDSLDIAWTYEPVGVEFGGVKYLPDFWLPSIRVWAEVKGPHDERVDKPRALQAELNRSVDSEWAFTRHLVVILRPAGPGNTATWEVTDGGQETVIVLCPNCDHYGFMDHAGTRWCRYCNNAKKKFWYEPDGGIWWSGEIPFARAPRPERNGR